MTPKKDKQSNDQENLEWDDVSGDNSTGDGTSSKGDIASGPSTVGEATSSTIEEETEKQDQRANERLDKTTKQAQIRQRQSTQNSDSTSKEPLQTTSATTNSTTSDTSEGDRYQQIPPNTDKKPASFKNICNYVVILLVLAFMAVTFAAIILAPPEPEMKTDFDFPKIFEKKLMELQTSFTNQTDRFWRIVKVRCLVHLRNTNPPQPLVLLLAAPPAAHGVVDCLARKLAEVLDPRNKRTLATIDGTEEKRFAGEKAKKKMDELLISKFKAGHRVALIHHLELLPPPSPLLCYSNYNDQNVPHKHVAIIFTVHLPAEPDASLSPSEAEGTVEKYLSSEVWAREDQDAVAALLNCVADTVALTNGEPDSVKASC